MKSSITSSIVWFVASIIICSISFIHDDFWLHAMLVLANLYSYYRCIKIWTVGGNRVLSLYVFFVLYLFASSLGQSVVSLIPSSLDSLSIYEKFELSDIMNALRFQLMCISGLGLGTSLYLCKHTTVSYEQQIESYRYTQEPVSTPFQSFIRVLFIISVLLVLSDSISYFLARQSMGYMDAYTERQLEGIPMYMQLSNWLIILLGFYFVYTKRYTKAIVGLFLFLIFVYLICGNRSLTIKYLASLVVFCPIVYPHLFSKKYILPWAGILFIFFSMMSVISSMRNDIGTSLSFASGGTSFGEMFLSSLSEMGGSANTLIYTMDAISKGFSHHLTELYFAITAVSTSSLCYILGIGDQYLALGDWVGDYAGIHGYGLGFSCLAEWFMNYGWGGCVFAIVYGYLITMAECVSYRKMSNGEFLIPVVLLTFLCTQIFYARSSMFYSLFDVRFGFWLIVIYKLTHYKRS